MYRSDGCLQGPTACLEAPAYTLAVTLDLPAAGNYLIHGRIELASTASSNAPTNPSGNSMFPCTLLATPPAVRPAPPQHPFPSIVPPPASPNELLYTDLLVPGGFVDPYFNQQYGRGAWSLLTEAEFSGPTTLTLGCSVTPLEATFLTFLMPSKLVAVQVGSILPP